MTHLRYAHYLIRHKWFVFLAGLQVKAPLWRLIIHDWSKFDPREWRPYATFFYAPKPVGHVAHMGSHYQAQVIRQVEAQRQADFDRAWLRHQHRNPHHWQHWVLRFDDGRTEALPMPNRLVKEMVADWMGAGRAITGKWDTASWYRKSSEKMLLHPATRVRVEATIPG